MSRLPTALILFWTLIPIAGLGIAGPAAGQAAWSIAGDPAHGRTIVIGFDGMDPELLERWMNAGHLPNFRKLAAQGSFRSLPTTNPAQSPVAWASFATGTNPGSHGLFDFLKRNLETYAPEYALATTIPGREWDVFGMRIPITNGTIVNQRTGEPFWISAEESGLSVSVLRVPVTYPPDDITRMLSGMGVPDLLGTQGTFTMFTVRDMEGENARVFQVTPEDGRVMTRFEGPANPLSEQGEPLSVPLSIEAAGPSAVTVELDDTTVELTVGGWSDWVPISFPVLWPIDVPGMVRLHLVSAFPDLQLYVSPINLDPRDPVAPISSPPDYAAELAERIGLYHTIGMPEETWSLNEGMISDAAYLDMVRTVLAEREAMFFDTLERGDSELIVTVFVQPDRVSHMFYRGLDRQHPLYESSTSEARGAIQWIYEESDRILGKAMGKLGPDDRLIVLSDHGFNPFRRSVHLNRWLVEHGYMALKGAPASESLFSNVNWTRTRAYALGLNGIYLNLAGREPLGIVREEDADALQEELITELGHFTDPKTGARVIRNAWKADDIYAGGEADSAPDLVIGYNEGYRASWQTALGGVPLPLIEDNARKWSGDHCVDPALVPGILLTSFPLDYGVESIREIPALIARTFQSSGTGANDNVAGR